MLSILWTILQLIILLIDLTAFVVTKIIIIILVLYSILSIKRFLKQKTYIKPNGKAVLITGCDSGFGNQLALSLNSYGFRVYATVLDTDSVGSKELLEKCENKDQMIVWKMDVTKDEDINEVYLKVKEDLHSNGCVLWSVVNNAATGIAAQIEWTGIEHFKDQFDVNIYGTVRVTKMFLPLIRQTKGHIINVSSMAGMITLNGMGAYSMTKRSIRAFSDTLRRELHKFGVKVVTIIPSAYSNTNFIENMFKTADKLWIECDDSIKTSYGHQKYYEFWRNKLIAIFNNSISDKPIDVVNTMVEAITNIEPKITYFVLGQQIHDQIYSRFPEFIKDCILSF